FSCGFFELLVDGAVVDSADLSTGACVGIGNAVVRDTLSATGLSLSAGSHEIRIRIVRAGTNFPSTSTPREYVDNVTLTQESSGLPTSKDQCKKDGWKTFGVFKNQGDCVSFVATGGANPPSGPGA